VTPKDKRSEARFRVARESYVSYPGGTGRIGDLSMGGVFVHDPDPLPEGTTFDFDLHLGSEVVRIHGVVRHTSRRTGMGVEFEAVSPANKGLLKTCLHAVASGPAEAPAQAKETAKPRTAPVETPPPPATAEEATARLQRISAELRSLESALSAAHSDHRVLREFRDAVDQVRVTAWSVQKWQEIESERGDPYAVLPRLVNERIRRATQLSNDVTQDLDAEELEMEREGLEELAGAVDRLHERLSRIFRHLRKK
jgi:hypothetical protein